MDIIKILSIVIFLFTSTQCFSNVETIHKKINSILKQQGKNTQLGIKIQHLDNNQILFQKNASQTLIPASTLKLFTATSALLYLGSEYTYRTNLFLTHNNIQNGILNGDVYLQFTGDPSLKERTLNHFFQTLKNKGLSQINGNLYLDGSIFEDENFAPGWLAEDAAHCYSALPIAFILNHNCVELTVNARKNLHSPVIIQLKKPNPYIHFTDAVTVESKESCEVKIIGTPENNYQINGCLPPSDHYDPIYLAIINPVKYIKQTIKNSLNQNNIQLKGEIVLGSLPKDAFLITTHQSKPLRLLINTMLKESDNLIADILLKTLAVNYFHKTGSWQSGVIAMKNILQAKTKMDLKNANFVDGSGLSRENLVTPEQLVTLLKNIYRNFEVAPELISALPVAGINGTLKDHMPRAKVRAKTGAMTHIRNLAGFVETKDHKILVFSMMFNSDNGSAEKYQKIQNQICEYLSSVRLTN